MNAAWMPWKCDTSAGVIYVASETTITFLGEKICNEKLVAQIVGCFLMCLFMPLRFSVALIYVVQVQDWIRVIIE